MKKVILVSMFFMTIFTLEANSQSTLSENTEFASGETEFIVRNNPITIFKASSFIRFYSVMNYRIKNTGSIILKVIYGSEISELEPGCSLDVTVENLDLKIDGDHVTKGNGSYRIVNIVKP